MTISGQGSGNAYMNRRPKGMYAWSAE